MEKQWWLSGNIWPYKNTFNIKLLEFAGRGPDFPIGTFYRYRDNIINLFIEYTGTITKKYNVSIDNKSVKCSPIMSRKIWNFFY